MESLTKVYKPNKARVRIIAIVLLLTILLPIMAVATKEVRKNGEYHSKDEVAYYIYNYGRRTSTHLPKNYVLKPESKEESGNHPTDGTYYYAKHYYRGTIKKYTSKTDLIECDLDYPINDELRGENRLVFSADCKEVYYTDNHYKYSFEPIIESSLHLNAKSNVYTAMAIIVFVADGLYIYMVRKNKDKWEIFIIEIKEVPNEYATWANKILKIFTKHKPNKKYLLK